MKSMIADLSAGIAQMKASMARVDPEAASAIGQDVDTAESQLAAMQKALPNCPDAQGSFVFGGEMGDWSSLDPANIDKSKLNDPSTIKIIQNNMQEVSRLADVNQEIWGTAGGWASEYNKLKGWVSQYQKLLGNSTSNASVAVTAGNS
jgi:hypothetical protein